MSQITFDVEASEPCLLSLIPTKAFSKVEQQNIFVKNFSLALMMERMSSLANTAVGQKHGRNKKLKNSFKTAFFFRNIILF